MFFRDRLNHSSPNSGNSEAAFAGDLGVQYGGKKSYLGKVYDKPTIWDRLKCFDLRDIKRAIRLLYVTSWVGLALFFVIRYAIALIFSI